MEKREHRRVPLGVPVLCQSGRTKVEGMAENVSISGLCLVRAAKTFPENENITVSFVIPGSTEALRVPGATKALRARVVRAGPDQFMGVRFLKLSQKSKELMELYVAAHSDPEAESD